MNQRITARGIIVPNLLGSQVHTPSGLLSGDNGRPVNSAAQEGGEIPPPLIPLLGILMILFGKNF